MKAIKYLSCILIAFQSTSSQVISWERVAAPNHLISDMLFISNGNLIAGTLTAGIFISTNKGISWFPSNQGLSSNNIYAVEKTPSETIFIGTGGDGVYRSTNQGQSWEFFGLYNKYINTMTILNDSEIFVGTFGESVFYSSDRGNTWIERGNGIYFPVIIKMTANDSGVVFLCTDTGRMYRTTDKGLEWVEINNGLPYTTANSLIIDYSRILYAGNNEGLFISGNNGDIWIKRINGLTEKNLLAISNNSLDHIFISVLGDGVYRSKNQGHIWIKESEGLGSADIYLLLASDDDYIYASGWANDFFRTKYPTVVSVEDITVVLKTYHLSQNYPNPFNPTTKIKYSVPHVETRNASSLQMVTLKVYDVLGNEIATLVNEEKQPGTYEVEFDGKQLPSGIYFYKLNAGKFSMTKKMVLIK